MKIADKSEDPRFQRTLEALIESVTRLIEAEGLAGLSITRVVAEAGVSRPTFYQHAPDVMALARRAALMRLDAAMSDKPALDDPAGAGFRLMCQQIEDHLCPLLQHLATNRRFYVEVLDHASSPDLYSAIVELLASRMQLEPFQRLGSASGVSFATLARVLSGGLLWHVVRWRKDAPEPLNAEAMAAEVAITAATFVQGQQAVARA